MKCVIEGSLSSWEMGNVTPKANTRIYTHFTTNTKFLIYSHDEGAMLLDL